MGRAPCCDKANVKKGPWSPEEDAKLKAYIEENGTGGNWIALPQKIGLKRCGKSCRLRWLNYLRPNIKHGGFTEEEDRIICNLYVSIGSRWSIIAAQLPGRTDNDIKNYWNTRLKKKLFGKQVKEHGIRRGRSIKQEITKRGIGYPMHQDNNNNNKITFWPELPVLAPIPYPNQDPNFSFNNSLTKIEERFCAPSKPIHEGTNLQFLVGHMPSSHQLSEQHNSVSSSDPAGAINNIGNQYMHTQYYTDGADLPAFQGQSSLSAELEEILSGNSQRLEGLGNLYEEDMVNATRVNNPTVEALSWVEMNYLVNPFASNCGTSTEQGLLPECPYNELKHLGVQ